MKKSVFTIQELSRPEHFNRSPGWIRCGIRIGLIRAMKVGNTYAVELSERNRIKADMPHISREEYHRGLAKN